MKSYPQLDDLHHPDILDQTTANAKALAQARVNSFILSDELESSVVLYPTFSFLNHSCEPNAILTLLGRTGVLRALLPIESGQEILICYNEDWFVQPRFHRRYATQTTYHFTCACTRCSRNDHPIDKFIGGEISDQLTLLMTEAETEHEKDWGTSNGIQAIQTVIEKSQQVLAEVPSTHWAAIQARNWLADAYQASEQSDQESDIVSKQLYLVLKNHLVPQLHTYPLPLFDRLKRLDKLQKLPLGLRERLIKLERLHKTK